jgi:hypothetical protein
MFRWQDNEKESIAAMEPDADIATAFTKASLLKAQVICNGTGSV